MPFVAGDAQVAAIFPQLTIRIVVPHGRPPQGIADLPRKFDIKHGENLAETVSSLNASVYLPKLTTSITDDGSVSIRMTHVFNWPVGATAQQVTAEIRGFLTGCLAMSKQFNDRYPDQWSQGE